VDPDFSPDQGPLFLKRQMKRALNKASTILDKICQVLCILSLVVLIATTNIAVFFRYVLHSPLTWSNELATYLLFSFTFWGATMGLLHDKFFAVDTIVELLPKRIKLSISVISKILISIFLLFAIMFTRPLIEQATLTRTLSPALRIPMRLIYLFLMTGLLFMFFGNIFSLLNSLISLFVTGDKNSKSKNREKKK